MERYVLSLDYGTQSVRGMVFDPQGKLLWKKRANMPQYQRPYPGWAEVDPEEYKKLTIWICRVLREERPEIFSAVEGICIACMRDCLAVVDAEGKALRPMILWLDQRRTQVIRPRNPLLLAGASLIGAGTLIREAGQVGYTNYLIDCEPEIWKKADKFVLLSGYLHRWLLGFFCDSLSNQAGHIPFDSKRQKWADWRDVKYHVYPVEPEKRVPLVPSGTVMGNLSAAAQADTGLSARVQVIAAAPDKACETLGTGCADDTEAVLSFGSQATVQTISRKYYELQQFVPSFPAATPGCWSPELQVYRGYWMIQWFLKEMENAGVQEQEHPEDTFDTYLRKTPAGNDGLVMYPYMGASAKYPRSSGTIMGLRDYHGKAHLYRAMIEGINYTLRWAVERMETLKKSPVQIMKVTGGGSSSDTICQLTADMFGRPAVRMETADTTSLGAAIVGYTALGVHKDYTSAVQSMTKIEKTFLPDPQNTALYNTLYDAYQKDLEKRIHFNTQRG